MCGNTLTTLKDNCLDTLQEIVGDENLHFSPHGNSASLFGRKIRLVGAGDVAAIRRIQGSTRGGVYCDELTTFPESSYNMLTTRMSVPGAKLFATTNPDLPGHWVKKNLIDRDLPDVEVTNFYVADNPFLPEDFVASLQRMYTGVFYRRFVLGQWVAADGAVYPMFDREEHVYSNRPLIREISFGIDVGHSNATVFLAIGVGKADKDDKGDKAFILSEFYHSGRDGVTRSPSRYAQDFVRFRDDVARRFPEARIYDVYVDPSAKGFSQQLDEAGVRGVRNARNDVLDGIRLVMSVIDADLLRVHESCEYTINELEAYSWDDKAAERGIDQPIKVDDHCVDAIRYYFMTNQDEWYERAVLSV
jgi:PBSX family phage terminase large subunit